MAKRKKKYTPQPNKYLGLLSNELRGEVTGQKTVASLTREESEILRLEYNIRPTPICWGVPMDEVMFSKWFTNYLYMSPMPWDSYATTEGTYLSKARNDIHNRFIKDTDAPYLMMLDSDVLPPPPLVDILMGHKKHIVGGWYKNKNLLRGPHPIVFDFDSEADGLAWKAREESGVGLEQVDGMGAGCWLMSRELAEKLGENPYNYAKDAGEDLVICKKIMDLGYEMWVDWDMPCAHMGVSWV